MLRMYCALTGISSCSAFSTARTEAMESGVSLLEPQLDALLAQAKQLGVSLPELLQLINERW